jgi:transcriptional regulator with XRE-family HTH domain
MTDNNEAWLSRSDTTPEVDQGGAVLKSWREANKQGQGEIARALGMTQQGLSLIENGKRPLSLEQRRKIVELLGIEPQELGLSSGQARSLVSVDDANPEISASRLNWRAQRRWYNQHRIELARLATSFYPDAYRPTTTAWIAYPEWLATEPLPLRSLQLTLSEQPHAVKVDGTEPETEPVRPLRTPGAHFDRYTSAIKHLDAPQLFESRPSYRLMSVALNQGKLDFGLAAYFDKLDVSEALSHELALACMNNGGTVPDDIAELRGKLPFRELIGDPFDPLRRAIVPGITTLTIRLRRDGMEPSFLLHWRDGARVAAAGGMYGVIPEGEFQPASVALWDRHNDLDLWRNIVREYSEELLGEPEHDGTRTQPIDYDNWPLYQQLEQAQKDGTVRTFLLGIGMDALSLGTGILTVVVIEDEAFESIFGSAVRYNEEGEIVTIGNGKPTEGVPFTEENVTRMLTQEPMGSSGATCLALAWKYRKHLLGR